MIWDHQYDENFALAIAKCSESQIPILLETMEKHILKCDSMTTYVMKRLVSNCHVSSVTAKQIRNRLERILGFVRNKSSAMTRVLVVLCDRCDVFLGLDPFERVTSCKPVLSSLTENLVLSSRDEIAEALDMLCRERQRRLQSRFVVVNSDLFDVDPYVNALWTCLFAASTSWITVLTAWRLDTLCHFTQKSKREENISRFLRMHVFSTSHKGRTTLLNDVRVVFERESGALLEHYTRTLRSNTRMHTRTLTRTGTIL